MAITGYIIPKHSSYNQCYIYNIIYNIIEYKKCLLMPCINNGRNLSSAKAKWTCIKRVNIFILLANNPWIVSGCSQVSLRHNMLLAVLLVKDYLVKKKQSNK